MRHSRTVKNYNRTQIHLIELIRKIRKICVLFQFIEKTISLIFKGVIIPSLLQKPFV